MSEPTLNYVVCADAGPAHRMAYWQWGRADAAHTVVCVHGLSRQGRDFDVLAQTLVQRAGGAIRVVCPDVVGRGKSDWLEDPLAYQLPLYVSDMLTLLKHLVEPQQAQKFDWVGTSMGGLIGLGVCAHASSVGVQVRRLVLNDVGPVLQWQALVRIGSYLGQSLEFESLQAAADALWESSRSFGPHTPQQWLELSRHMVKPLPGAKAGTGVCLHYDPAISVSFKDITPESALQAQDMLWEMYDRITAPTLLLRGAQSDLLSATTALEMTQRGPHARLVEFPEVGHAPTLLAADQLDVVVSFLLE